MLYNGLINFVVVVSCFMAIKAVADCFCSWSIFNGKATLCVISGSFLGMFISAPLSAMSKEAGYIGIGIGISIVFIIAYTGFISTLISLIPAKIRNILRSIFNIIKIALCVVIIMFIVYVVLSNV